MLQHASPCVSAQERRAAVPPLVHGRLESTVVGLRPGHLLFALMKRLCQTPVQSEGGKSLDSDYRTYAFTFLLGCERPL
ncbi:hypothetical protein Y032_0045g1130 [Ancylostoma ceylanicum]|uniref:Uncharacterized protein n=1 Tax=Ancylostoma ceylanicum TaxID=53326 RepID=A0A016UC18_9BILA|nr:hypothetical protein Y032_0045g1130 [Ancylostoma ceylanicum]